MHLTLLILVLSAAGLALGLTTTHQSQRRDWTYTPKTVGLYIAFLFLAYTIWPGALLANFCVTHLLAGIDHRFYEPVTLLFYMVSWFVPVLAALFVDGRLENRKRNVNIVLRVSAAELIVVAA